MVPAGESGEVLEQLEDQEGGASIEDAVRALVPDEWRNSREWVLGGLAAVVLRRYGPLLLSRLRNRKGGD